MLLVQLIQFDKAWAELSVDPNNVGKKFDSVLVAVTQTVFQYKTYAFPVLCCMSEPKKTGDVSSWSQMNRYIVQFGQMWCCFPFMHVVVWHILTEKAENDFALAASF